MAVKKEESFLSFLSKLANEHSSLADSLHVERATLVQMQEQVLQLCQKRDRLMQQLEESTKQLKIVKKKSGVIENLEPELGYDEKKNLLQELFDIYGLMGVQLCNSDRNNVVLKFTSTSDGRYKCTYMLELSFSEENKIIAEKYDLPAFIPLDKILNKKTSNYDDLSAVAKEVSDYLYAYNVRDKDVHDIENLYGPDILSGLQYSLARELIYFKLVKHYCALDCKLSYVDLLAVQPDEINVQCTDLDQRYSTEWLEKFQESSGWSLAEMKLPLAINSILQALDVAAAELDANTENSSCSEKSGYQESA